jgi:hypothetical protein
VPSSQATKGDAAAAAEAAARGLPAEPRVAPADVFSATLADLLAILERATSGESGLHASGVGRQLALGCPPACLPACLREGPTSSCLDQKAGLPADGQNTANRAALGCVKVCRARAPPKPTLTHAAYLPRLRAGEVTAGRVFLVCFVHLPLCLPFMQ